MDAKQITLCTCRKQDPDPTRCEARIAEVERMLREAKAEAWDEGHKAPRRRGPDKCRCHAYSSGECGCGLYGSGELVSLKNNPYRD